MPRRNDRGPDAPKTVADMCRVSGLGKDLVKAGIISGQLPGYLVGTRYVIPAEAFDAFCRNEFIPRPRPLFEQPQPAPKLLHTRKTQPA